MKKYNQPKTDVSLNMVNIYMQFVVSGQGSGGDSPVPTGQQGNIFG